MTNEQKYKSAEERVKAFLISRKSDNGSIAATVAEHFAGWLALEAEEEKPMPCPFCGSECRVRGGKFPHDYAVSCLKCGYMSTGGDAEAEAIAAHNRVAHAVRAADDGERLAAVVKHLEKYKGTKEPDYCCADCIEDIAKEVGFSFACGDGGEE